MRVVVTGATGMIGRQIVAALKDRGDEVTALARDATRAAEALGVSALPWDAEAGPAPHEAFAGADAVVHLAGAPVAQRWTEKAKAQIRDSRVAGTQHLVAGLKEAEPRPAILVSTSAAGYYGDRGEQILDETAAPGPPHDFLASVCIEWERAAQEAAALGIRVTRIRNGVVLDARQGALRQMLPPFKAFVGGPVAGGRQYMPWIALEDAVGLYLAALDDERFAGPLNAAAPDPATNAEFSRALGRALHRPAVVPVPALALKALYGEMAEVVLASQRMVPARATELGYEFRRPRLDEALRATLA